LERFEIHKSRDGQYYFTLYAPNNEIICFGETYKEKQSCQDGIKSVKKVCIKRTNWRQDPIEWKKLIRSFLE